MSYVTQNRGAGCGIRTRCLLLTEQAHIRNVLRRPVVSCQFTVVSKSPCVGTVNCELTPRTLVRGRRIERLSLGCRPRVLSLCTNPANMVRVGRLEPPSQASEACALSVELHALNPAPALWTGGESNPCPRSAAQVKRGLEPHRIENRTGAAGRNRTGVIQLLWPA